MNAETIKRKIRRLLATLRSEPPSVINDKANQQCKPILTIKEDIEEQDQFPHDFSLKNHKN